MGKAAAAVAQVVEETAEIAQSAVVSVATTAEAAAKTVENIVEKIEDPKTSMKWVFIAGGVLAVVAAFWLMQKPVAPTRDDRRR